MQVAVLRAEGLEVGEVSEGGGEGFRVGEVEVGEIQIDEVCEVAECGRNASLQGCGRKRESERGLETGLKWRVEKKPRPTTCYTVKSALCIYIYEIWEITRVSEKGKSNLDSSPSE